MVKKVFLKILHISQEKLCWSVFINKVAGSVGSFIKKETLAYGFAFSRSVICLEINLSPYVIDM